MRSHDHLLKIYLYMIAVRFCRSNINLDEHGRCGALLDCGRILSLLGVGRLDAADCTGHHPRPTGRRAGRLLWRALGPYVRCEREKAQKLGFGCQ